MRYLEIIGTSEISEAKPLTTKQWQARTKKKQKAAAKLQATQIDCANKITRARQKLQEI